MIRRRFSVLCAALSLFFLTAADAHESSATNGGSPAPVSGTIRIWSNPEMRGVIERWQSGFRSRYPGASIVANSPGSDAAMAALYTGHADVALLGREPTASEIQAFEWINQFKPTRVEIMTGSLDEAGRSPAVVVFVHRDNPLAKKLTLAQLDAIFGYEHRRGLDAIRTWGQLGLKGKWAAQPIQLYGPDSMSGTGLFFRHTVLADSRKLNWDRLHEFSDQKLADGSEIPAGRQIVDALAHDRYGIGVAHLGYVRPELRPVALAADQAGPFVEPTAETVASRQYPLARTAIALVRRIPGHTVDPLVREFLNYVLSDEGQAQIARDGSFLPLSAEVIRKQLVMLE